LFFVAGALTATAWADDVPLDTSSPSDSVVHAPPPPKSYSTAEWQHLLTPPDTERIFEIQKQLAANPRGRVHGPEGITELAEPGACWAGVLGRATFGHDSVGPPDTLAWSRVQELEIGYRGVANGAKVGAQVGATPGVVVMSVGANDGSMAGAVFFLVGGVLAVGGAVAGAVIGSVAGAATTTWEPIYRQPEVQYVASVSNPPARVIAVAAIEQRSAPRADKQVTQSAMRALRNSGFTVVPPETVSTIVIASLGKKNAKHVENWRTTPAVLSKIEGRTEAKALLNGTVTRVEGKQALRVAFLLTAIPSGKAYYRAQTTVDGTRMNDTVADQTARELLDPVRSLPRSIQ
jgi:hypothetical protein